MIVRRVVVSQEIEVEAHSYLEVAYKSEGLRGRVVFGFENFGRALSLLNLEYLGV